MEKLLYSGNFVFVLVYVHFSEEVIVETFFVFCTHFIHKFLKIANRFSANCWYFIVMGHFCRLCSFSNCTVKSADGPMAEHPYLLLFEPLWLCFRPRNQNIPILILIASLMYYHI